MGLGIITMALPQTRDQLIEWALRKLGKPVIEINVDCEQLEDRLDEALQVYQEYHFDATEKVYEPYQVTATDIANRYIEFDPNPYVTITKVVPASNSGASGMFNLEYQLRLQDYVAFGATTWGGNLTGYSMYQQNLSLLKEILVGTPDIRYSKHSNRLHIDWKWGTDIREGEFIVVESYKILDPETYNKIYNDQFLKRYLYSLIKEQWGQNLSKFQNILLPGGVSLNGDQIAQQARDELQALRDEMSSKWELPVDFYMA